MKGRAPRFPGQKHHRSADRLPTLSPFDEERIVWRKNMEDDVENEDARRRRREREWALRSSDDHDHHQRHAPPVSTASSPPPPSLIQVHLDDFFLNLLLAFSRPFLFHRYSIKFHPFLNGRLTSSCVNILTTAPTGRFVGGRSDVHAIQGVSEARRSSESHYLLVAPISATSQFRVLRGFLSRLGVGPRKAVAIVGQDLLR